MNEYHGITLPDAWLCQCCGRARAAHGDCLNGFQRATAEFVGMLRIRNEARWIAEVIEAALALCSHLYILDDHSTDETVEVCRRYEPRVTVFASPFSGLNEARDKNWLYDQIMRQVGPQWMLCVDGDEVLAPTSVTAIREVTQNPDCPAYSLQILFLWNDRQTIRTDWIYGEFWRPSLFRPFHARPGVPDEEKLANYLRFMATPFGRRNGDDEPNLHCSSVPQPYLGQARRCPGGQLLHLGYMHRADRVKKLDFYTGCDWLDLSEDCYRHMTQGDGVRAEELPVACQRLSQRDLQFICDLPAEVKHGEIWNGRPLLHAGPLTLQPLSALL